jgi:hypothetical protein
LLLQQRGAAGVPILTDAFKEQMERVLMYYDIDRPMPVVVIPHPMQNVGPAELDARAASVADQVEQMLRPT